MATVVLVVDVDTTGFVEDIDLVEDVVERVVEGAVEGVVEGAVEGTSLVELEVVIVLLAMLFVVGIVCVVTTSPPLQVGGESHR